MRKKNSPARARARAVNIQSTGKKATPGFTCLMRGGGIDAATILLSLFFPPRTFSNFFSSLPFFPLFLGRVDSARCCSADAFSLFLPSALLHAVSRINILEAYYGRVVLTKQRENSTAIRRHELCAEFVRCDFSRALAKKGPKNGAERSR